MAKTGEIFHPINKYSKTNERREENGLTKNHCVVNYLVMVISLSPSHTIAKISQDRYTGTVFVAEQ